MEKHSRRHFIKAAGLLSALPAFSFAASQKEEEKRKLVFPELHTGDTIGIVSPAGAIYEKKSLDEFVAKLESLSFKVILGKTTSLRTGYFAGTDKERAADVMDLFTNKKVKGLFAAKGGWGCARILPLLDYKLIRENPKVLIGFSDITSLLNAVTKKTGLVTFHGPVGNSSWNDFSIASFRKCVLEKEDQTIELKDEIKIWSAGKASGPVYGGNLSVLCSLIGTDWLPELKGAILMLEETTEEPFRIDRMLTQLQQTGIFDSIAGIVFGKCTKCIAEEPDKAFTTEEVFQQHFSERKFPVISGISFGHTLDKLTIPLGCRTELNTQKGSLLFSVVPG